MTESLLWWCLHAQAHALVMVTLCYGALEIVGLLLLLLLNPHKRICLVRLTKIPQKRDILVEKNARKWLNEINYKKQAVPWIKRRHALHCRVLPPGQFNGVTVARGGTRVTANVRPSDLRKISVYVINCKLCSNSKNIYHKIPFQATSGKKIRGGGSGERAAVQVGSKLSWDPWMPPSSAKSWLCAWTNSNVYGTVLTLFQA